MKRATVLAVAMGAVGAMAAVSACLAGCSSGSAAQASGPGYWTHQRMLGAMGEHRPARLTPSPGSTPEAKQNAKTFRIGALFESDTSGGHFCTASVVDSPGRNVIVTAAHCVNGGNGGGNNQNIAFAPGYSNGNAPYGMWTPQKFFMDSRWLNGHDDRFDIAFLTVQQRDGKNIQDVIGGSKIAFNDGYEHYVRVAGYPASADAPIRCWNWTSKYQGSYLKFPCKDFLGGTSGSPFITGFDKQTIRGTVVGVLGGYQEGGDTSDVSYSDYLGDDIEKLYKQATS